MHPKQTFKLMKKRMITVVFITMHSLWADPEGVGVGGRNFQYTVLNSRHAFKMETTLQGNFYASTMIMAGALSV